MGTGDLRAGLVHLQDMRRDQQRPNQLLHSMASSTTLATGMCWNTSAYTTHARTFGPYEAGAAVTPAGARW
jgi:hypothetical protein